METLGIPLGKNILIFGYGLSGESTYKFLKEKGHNVFTFDESKTDTPDRVSKIDFTIIDIIVKSPSIPCLGNNAHPILNKAKEQKIKILSAFDIFRIYNPDARIIAVTGTNGKSTTTSLIYHILKKSRYSIEMGGNIGIPYFEAPKADIYVFEMSSYELASSKHLDFEIGCVLNIEPDHISFHGSFENYIAAKHLVLDNSKIKIVSFEDYITMAKYLKSENLIKVSINDMPFANYFIKEGVLIDSYAERAVIDLTNLPELKGIHNRQNVLFAYAVCIKLGLQPSEIARNMQSFKALPHRMSSVRKIGNILFVNDSKGTNPSSSAKALATFVGYRIFWLVGGRSKRTNPLLSVSNYIDNVCKIYLFGESEEEFEYIFKGIVKTTRCKTMDIALNVAYKEAKKETGPTVILLSPMCASFDQFENFEQRGERFAELVLNLK